MNIILKRIYTCPTYTIGKLYIDGVYFCDTLEDSDRGLLSSMSLEEIKRTKVYGDTAIPKGNYEVVLNVVSPKFKDRTWAKPYGGKVPRLLDVPGYEGILIHPGNFARDTFGCILLGYNKIKGLVVNSTATFHNFMSKVKDFKNINITIE